jgi:hypothetical protein
MRAGRGPCARAQVPRRVGNKYAQSGKNGVTPVVAAWLIDAAATGTVRPAGLMYVLKLLVFMDVCNLLNCPVPHKLVHKSQRRTSWSTHCPEKDAAACTTACGCSADAAIQMMFSSVKTPALHALRRCQM